MSVGSHFLAFIGGAGSLLGAYAFGHSVGSANLADSVRDAEEKGYLRGSEAVRQEYQDAEHRNEILARLLAVVRSPNVQQVLPDETKQAVELVAPEIQENDYEAAAKLLSGMIAVGESKCLKELESAVVEQGTAVSSCHIYGTRALIGVYSEETNELAVTVNGERMNLSPGRAFEAGYAQCDLLFERIVEVEEDKAVRVSFSC